MNAKIIKAQGRQGTRSFVRFQKACSVMGTGFGGGVAATARRRQYKKGLRAARDGLYFDEVNGRVVRAVLRNLCSVAQAEKESEARFHAGARQAERQFGYVAW